MRALTIKMFRDLGALRGQAFAIALVIAAGVATYEVPGATCSPHENWLWVPEALHLHN